MEPVWLGEVPYKEALSLQLEYLDRRAHGRVGDTLLLLTHPHVFTIGRGGDPANLLVSEEDLARDGVAVERIGRGGDITYHGPGQLVGYPIVHLPRPDLHRFVRAIETALIEALHAFGIVGKQVPGMTGVWADGRKIASIGIGVKRWITWHGFALNVNTDLAWFRKIHLCGLKGKEATSMAALLGRDVPMGTVHEAVAGACCRRLGGSP